MVKQLTFERATLEHLDHIADNMWHEDVAELLAAGNKDVKTALLDSLKMSKTAIVASYEGEPLVIYGLRRMSTLGSTGIPWMLTTTNSKQYRREFMVYTRQVILAMLDECEYLYNYVHVKNKTSIKWLKVLGFTMDEPMTNLTTNEQFQKFWIRR